MRKLRNTLYITDDLSRLSKDGMSIVISKNDTEVGRIPIHNLEGVICFNYMGASPQVMELCASNDVGLCFISPYGKFLARVTGKISGNVHLRKKQYFSSENEIESTRIASYFVLGKLMNCRNVMQRFARDYPDRCSKEFQENLKNLSEGIIKIRSDMTDARIKPSLNELRGFEGILSKYYFDSFDHLILSNEPEFIFERRIRRPPLNRVNALLSFVYTLISMDCASALESVGLDPQVGFLHRDRPGRMSLALDLMEEFRPYLGDRFVLNLINNRIVSKNDFVIKENGAVLMTDDTRKKILTHWQNRKKEIINHSYLEEKIEVGLLPYAQAMLLARHLRGDIDGYPPFNMK